MFQASTIGLSSMNSPIFFAQHFMQRIPYFGVSIFISLSPSLSPHKEQVVCITVVCTCDLFLRTHFSTSLCSLRYVSIRRLLDREDCLHKISIALDSSSDKDTVILYNFAHIFKLVSYLSKAPALQ
jgi:hypothetical protein